MKYLLFVLSCLIIFPLSSCKDSELETPFDAPTCVQTIIEDFQGNDMNSSCITAVRRYTFEGATVFEVQDDNCIDGLVYIIDTDCNTICTLISTGFTTSYECESSENFYNDAVLVGEMWKEVN